MAKTIVNLIVFDAHSEIPTTAFHGQLAYCREHNKLHDWQATGMGEVGASAAHPDLATHVGLGLLGGVHDHDADYEPLDHVHSEYEPVHTHPYEATGAVSTHAGLADPHTVYLKETDANYLDLTDGTATTLHSHAGGPSGGMNLLKKTANQTINAGAGVFADITDLTFPVVSGTDYAFSFYIAFQSAATTTGWKAGVNCPTGTLDFWAGSQTIANGAAGVATHVERHNTVRDDMTLLTATVTQAVDLSVRIEGRYRCTANGTFAARFANELAANTQVVVQQGSWGWWF